MTFNYIVTIHNSADHLRPVLDAVKRVKGKDSKVRCILDGCTDQSLDIVIEEYPDFDYMIWDDVRETKAITLTLNQLLEWNTKIPSMNALRDYQIILQDDVILKDPKLEEHIEAIYKKFAPVGVLGFRHGCNFCSDVMTKGKYASECDLIQSEHQAVFRIPVLKSGFITERQVVYKSPICLSREVVEKLGGYDERFFPIAHDDTEYCLRAMKAGYKNYVAAVDVEQPMAWGGTRRNIKVNSDSDQLHIEHLNLLRTLYPKELEYFATHHPPQTKMTWKTL